MTTARPTFGALCHERRKALNFTQEYVAREVGCQLRTLQRIEKGEIKSPQQSTLLGLMKLLGIAAEEVEVDA